MNKKITNIFPTFLTVYQHETSFRIAKDIQDLIYVDSQTQADKSLETHLEKNAKFKNLFDWIKNCLDDYKDNFNFHCDKLEISLAWANRSSQKKFHHLHVHPNSFLSAIYYLEKVSPTYFQDPRQTAMTTGFSVDSDSNIPVYTFDPEPNSLIIFPSWLTHFTMPEQSENYRYTMAINIIPTGAINKGTLDELNIHLSN